LDTAKNMKLLILTNKPDRASCKQRIGIFQDYLSKNGIESDICSFPSGIIQRLNLIKLSRQYDAVFLQKKRLRATDVLWAKYFSPTLIYDIDDAVMFSHESPEIDCPTRQKKFRRTAKLADIIFAGNQYLKENAEKVNPNVKIIPTGLDVSEYESSPDKLEKDGKIRLVWIGSKDTLQYLRQIAPALEEIGKRFDNVVLRIVCNHFFDLDNMPVEKHKWSLKTQASDLCTSDIGLAPLPDDRFTKGKCGFKILQYSAASLPSVASPVGVNADFAKENVRGFHASNIQQWVDAISKMVENDDMRKEMGKNAKKWVQDFDIEVLGEKLCKLIKQSV